MLAWEGMYCNLKGILHCAASLSPKTDKRITTSTHDTRLGPSHVHGILQVYLGVSGGSTLDGDPCGLAGSYYHII